MSTEKNGTPSDHRASKAVLVEKMQSHDNDPFVVKKVESAKKAVSKIDFTADVFNK